MFQKLKDHTTLRLPVSIKELKLRIDSDTGRLLFGLKDDSRLLSSEDDSLPLSSETILVRLDSRLDQLETAGVKITGIEVKE